MTLINSSLKFLNLLKFKSFFILRIIAMCTSTSAFFFNINIFNRTNTLCIDFKTSLIKLFIQNIY